MGIPKATLSTRRALPLHHVQYEPCKVDEQGAVFTAITMMPAYARLSTEELRYAQQYHGDGGEYACIPIERLPHCDTDAARNERTYRPTIYRHHSDYDHLLLSITAADGFAHMSFEELRYLHATSNTDSATAEACEAAIPIKAASSLRIDVIRPPSTRAASTAATASDHTYRYHPTVCRGRSDHGLLLCTITAQDGLAHVSLEELRYLQTAGVFAFVVDNAATETKPTTSSRCFGSSESPKPRYTPTRIESETATTWRFVRAITAITAMDTFATTSFEELRLQDRNAPIDWRRVASCNRSSPVVSLMELRVRDAVGSIMDEIPDWWTKLNGTEDGIESRTRWMEPFTDQWTAKTVQQTIDAWYPVRYPAKFRTYMDNVVDAVREGGGDVSTTVPTWLGWMDADDVVTTPFPVHESVSHAATIDVFAFLGYFCAQARLVVKLRQAEEGFEWTSARAEILDGVGELVAVLVPQLLRVAGSENNDERTSAVILELLDVLEMRPEVLSSLRESARQVHEYIASCQQLAVDIFQLRSEEATIGRGGVMVESNIDSVYVSNARRSFLTTSLKMRKEIERLHQKLVGTRDCVCMLSSKGSCVMNPFLDTDSAKSTLCVPSFTSLSLSLHMNPYTRMSEIPFQHAMSAQPRDGTLTLWLPSDVAIDSDGRAVFASHIRNLHPKPCRRLYRQLERVLTHMIPSFEHAMSSLRRGHPLRPWLDSAAPQKPYVRGCLGQRPIPPMASLLSLFHSHGRPSLWSLKGSQVQVVVHMEEIHVSASQPAYTCEWDERGLLNDDIVAVGLYCYGAVNVTVASLGLMCLANINPISHSFLPRDPTSLTAFYGELDANPIFPLWPNCRVGTVSIRDGRSIVFPSTYRARLEGVEWRDIAGNGANGSLKLVWFYLVAPGSRVVSTANVPTHDRTCKFRSPDSIIEL